MKYLIACVVSLLAAHAQAQTILAEAKSSLTSTHSEVVLGEVAKELPEILINAFKEGKLKAYRFGFQKQPVYGALKAWPNPKNWVASTSYNKNDSVLYKGKLYRYVFQRNEPGVVQIGTLTPDIAPDAYGINDYWQEYKRESPVIGMNYNLPTEKDILTIENWEEVKSKATAPIPYWNPNQAYFPADMVIYQGKTYEAIRDNVKSEPTKQNDWQLTYRGISDDAFTELQFVYNKETRLPVVLKLSQENNNEVCIGFYLEAVKKYLSEVKQEILADKLERFLRENAH